MKNRLVMQKKIIAAALVLAFQGAYADASDFTICPPVEMLKAFDADYTEVFPTGFDSHTHTMNMSVLKKRWMEFGSLNFVLSVVPVSEGQDAEIIAGSLTENLQADYETPVMFRVDKHMSFPMCSYSLAGNDQVKATVFYIDGDRPNPFVK